jgi:hypothetical protein
MPENKKEVYHPCSSCNRETWHSILFSHLDSQFEYRVDTIHEVVQCCGCKTISFRKIVIDYESSYPIEENEWHIPQETYCYPSVLKDHKEFQDIWDLPDVVRNIYSQSLQAIKDNSNILAGIGLRATIEAICNEQNISGKNLDKRIDALARGGFISQKDADRLHAIRFLGNDAAHEIKTINGKNLLIALRIIEHLLINIYILDKDTDSSLDTIIKTSEHFIKFLNQKLVCINPGDEIPLAKVFGKDMRRFHTYFVAHEKHLISQINSGSFNKLSIGKLDNYANSKDKLQHFVVQ